jgi:hypothetical protein
MRHDIETKETIPEAYPHLIFDNMYVLHIVQPFVTLKITFSAQAEHPWSAHRYDPEAHLPCSQGGEQAHHDLRQPQREHTVSAPLVQARRPPALQSSGPIC